MARVCVPPSLMTVFDLLSISLILLPHTFCRPFVMNTQAQIRETIKEYRQGTFLKHRFPGNFKRKAEIDRINAERAVSSTYANQDEGGSDARADISDAATSQCGVEGSRDSN